MRDTIYLVMNANGVVSMKKKPPKLAGDERSVEITVNVDDKIFEYTFMKTELTVREEDVIEPSLDIQLTHSFNKL